MINLGEIDRRLCNWAEWVMRRDSGAIGFPRECAYTRKSASGGGGFIPSCESEAWQIEQAIVYLKMTDKILHQVIVVQYLSMNNDHLVIVVQYLSMRSAEQKHRVCGCSERTFFRRLQDAKLAIKKTLDTVGSKPV